MIAQLALLFIQLIHYAVDIGAVPKYVCRMKQNIVLKQYWKSEECAPSCRKCESCKVINLEDRVPELRNTTTQLYAKEAESYFFYYAPSMKGGNSNFIL